MSNIIDSIRMSGTTYAISDSGGTKVVEITQSDYDNLPASAKTANIMYVITDAEPFDVSNYYTKAETSGATELATAFAATQPKLSAGTNITIDANNVISASGSSITVDQTIDRTSENPISNKAISNKATDGNGDVSNIGGRYQWAFYSVGGVGTNKGFWLDKINGEPVIRKYNSTRDLSFVETSAITTSVTSSSTDAQVPSAKAVYVAIQGGGGGGIDSGTVQTMIDQSISGKTNQTDFVSHSGNSSIHVTTAQTAAWDAKSDFSGSYNDLTDKPTIPIVPTNVSSFNNDAGYITSNDISGKTNQTDFVSHSGNTTMHVTANEKSTWNNKSDFSGNYNDLSNKPTIPSKTSDLTNDSGYITSSALDGYATEAYVTAATNDMATKTWVGQQGYLTQHQDISGKLDVSAFNTYSGSVNTQLNSKASESDLNALNGTVTAHTANTTIHVTAQDKTNWNNKSDFSGDYNDLINKPTIPTVPTNVSDFTNDAGYATSGYVQSVTSDMATKTWVGQQGYLTQHQDISGKLDVSVFKSYSGTVDTELSNKLDTTAYTPVVIDSSLNTSSNNAVANSAITRNTLSGGVESNNYFRSVRFRKNNGEVAFYKRFAAINGNSVMVDGTTEAPNFQLVETSAITTSVTSASTDTQIPSAKAVYNALGGGGGNSVVELTQSEYDAMVTGGTVDPNTFYVITDAQEIDTDDYYTKSQTSGATELATAFGAKLDATAYTPTDLSNYYTKSETSGSSEISTALATKLNVSDFNTYSGTVNTSLNSKASQNDLDTLSGQVSTVSASTASNTTALGGLSLVKLTQSAYDQLQTKDPNTLYVIVN